MRLALIAIFGAVGTLARYGLQGLVQVRVSRAFPYGTLLVIGASVVAGLLLSVVGIRLANRL